jgi:type I restriction enzyme M protein
VVDGKPNTDLIPPTLIIRRYFAAEAAAIEQYEAERDAIALQVDELNEEHAGEDSLLAEARNDKGRLTRASVRARLAA